MEGTILQWNIRGISGNLEQLHLLINQVKPAVLVLQETLTATERTISGFNSTVSLPSGTGCQGISIYTNTTVLASPVQLNTNLHAVAARISLHTTVTVCCIYLSPSVSIQKADLEHLVEQLPRPFLLLGDFNGHSPVWGSDSASARGLLLEDVFSDLDLSVLNDGSPTHYSSASGTFSCIDLSVCDPSLVLDLEWSVHDDLCGSDHFPIIIQPNTVTEESHPVRWNIKKAQWDLFSRLVDVTLSAEDIFSSSDPAMKFTEILIDCARNTIPLSSSQPRKPKTPWFTDECKKVNKERKQAQRRVFQFPTMENVRKHQQLRAKARYVFKQSKTQSWRTFCSKLNYKISSKRVWNIIRKIKGKNSFNSVAHLKHAGKLITDKHQVANLLASTIAKNSSSVNQSRKFQLIKQKAENVKLDFSSDNLEDYNLPFTIVELRESLLKAHDSAAGLDEIHYQLLKHLSDNALQVVLQLFNLIWISDTFPTSWRQAEVIPIPKPGKDSSNPTNYRPIALTSCLCKTMERMINSRLMWQLETDGLLASVQCGFRKHRSTADHLVRLESYIRDAFLKKEHVVGVFFDLEKAYDTTWKHGILSDLHVLGFRGRLPLFIVNFLSDRTFRVRVGASLSDIHSQELGVPQGSILSPVLFSIKINNIVKSVTKDQNSSLFVDDFALAARGKTLAGIERQLQLVIDKIQRWVAENGFKFSVAKTECIHFHQKRDFFHDPVISLSGTPIKVVKEAKFLGLIFDQKLNFLSHLKYLKTSCMKALNVLRVVSHTSWGADKRTLLRLYRALIRSKLDYGCMVYGSARPSYLKTLDPVHHQGLRLCLGAFRTTPIYSLYAEAGEPSLSHRRLKLSMNYYLKLKSLPLNPAYDCVFQPNYKDLYLKNPSVIPPFGLRMVDHVENADLDLTVISDDDKFPFDPPWTFITPKTNFSLAQFRKDTTSPLVFKQGYLELREKFPDHLHVFTDGSKSDSGVASAAYLHTEPSAFFTHRLPDAGSIYTAELQALLLSLKLMYQSHFKKFLVFSDSLSALQAISHRNLNHPMLLDFFKLHSMLCSDDYDITFVWIPSHVGIRGNEIVDSLARQAVVEERSDSSVPFSDLKPLVTNYIKKEWQKEWDLQSDNKLYKIRPKLHEHLPGYFGSRREEVVLTRLHVGHCRLTHSFYFTQEDRPWCFACDEQLSVEHILLSCADLIEVRHKHYTAESMKQLFRDVPPDIIFNFLKEVNVFHLI